jgi:DNA-binding transcriptional LysR family regulator
MSIGPSWEVPGTMAGELDLRLLRHFVAVAEELHFTRAAARLYLAQQALSRDIARLEQQLGVRLFTRTTRRVALTADGERLLVRARELLALHDQTLQELGGHHRPLLVDLLAEGHTPVRVVQAARQRVPNVQLVGRFHGGLGAALHLLLAGGLDVAFGRSEGLGRPFPSQQLCRRLVRLEPLALLLPQEDPLAALDAVPMEALRGTQVDISAGNEQAPEWVDLGMRLLAAFGAEPSPSHPHAEGLEETVRHLRAEGLPILTLLERPVAPGVVVRPLTEPVPLYPWTMVFHRGLRHPGLDALQASVDELARRERWLELPPGPWLPQSDMAIFELAEDHQVISRPASGGKAQHLRSKASMLQQQSDSS